MVKRIILGIAFLGLVGILVGGAVIRTIYKTSQASESYGGQGQRQGDQDGGQRNGQNQDRVNTSEEATGTGIEAWLVHEGTVTAVDEEMVVLLAGEEELLIKGRSWSFAQEQGFSVQPGDRIKAAGFYEANTSFTVGQIDNLTTGQHVTLRDETGRPLWSGRGRRNT